MQTNNITTQEDTICAIATPSGVGAIAVIRVSGNDTFSIINKIFSPQSKKSLEQAQANTIHYGWIKNNSRVIDEVLVSVFKNPNSYTGEDSVEISCHGSAYIQQEILQLLVDKGARIARPGEFTLRAFLNGKKDLSQAEAVADLVVSNSKASHKLAIDQMRGEFSSQIKKLRKQLVDFTSLLELELDFSEEDVEFADRGKLKTLIKKIKKEAHALVDSFSMGNVLKNGIPVAIIGKPNVGKSTLLNAILKEERAIVSETPGTTRDTIEDILVINGISFRFIDTAGLRESKEEIENLGIERTYEKIRQAKIILYMFDAGETSIEEVDEVLKDIREKFGGHDKKIILLGNKIDMLMEVPKKFNKLVELETIFISAKRKENLHIIPDSLIRSISDGTEETQSTIVTNTRHYQALLKVQESVDTVIKGLEDNIPNDLLASDIRSALHYLGQITGEVTSDEILGNIFENFCIGK